MNGMMHMATKGRKGDTRVAHMTPGEKVIPKEVAAARPDVVIQVNQAIAQMGGDPRKYTVGQGSVNPATGAEEFATQAEIKSYADGMIASGKSWNDVLGVAKAKGVSFGELSGAYGMDSQQGAAYLKNNAGISNANYSDPFPNAPIAKVQPYGPYTAEQIKTTADGMIASGKNWNDVLGVAQEKGVSFKDLSGAYGMSDKDGARYLNENAGISGADYDRTARVKSNVGDVNNWFRNELGRDATDVVPQQWAERIEDLGKDEAYKQFQGWAAENGEIQKGLDLAGASAAWTGRQSGLGNNIVDEWARNEFGTSATKEEIEKFNAYKDHAQGQKFYEEFIAEREAKGWKAKNLGLVAATQLNGPPNDNNYASGKLTYAPATTRQVSANTETIEGRIGNLMATDAQGNYSNGVIRQAHDRAMQTFAKRGLLNSSMAAQAGQEAVIAKAIEIAGPDARTYFEQGRANQDAANQFSRDEINQVYAKENKGIDQANSVINKGIDQGNKVINTGIDQANSVINKGIDQENTSVNKTTDQANLLARDEATRAFTLRSDYQKFQSNISTNFQRQVDTINASQMTPDDKNVAIAQATTMRDGDLVYNNNMFSRMPAWKSEWLATATTGDEDEISSATNTGYLQNVINDPAQPQSMRDAASQRLKALRAEVVAAAAAQPVAPIVVNPATIGMVGSNMGDR